LPAATTRSTRRSNKLADSAPVRTDRLSPAEVSRPRVLRDDHHRLERRSKRDLDRTDPAIANRPVEVIDPTVVGAKRLIRLRTPNRFTSHAKMSQGVQHAPPQKQRPAATSDGLKISPDFDTVESLKRRADPHVKHSFITNGQLTPFHRLDHPTNARSTRRANR